MSSTEAGHEASLASSAMIPKLIGLVKTDEEKEQPAESEFGGPSGDPFEYKKNAVKVRHGKNVRLLELLPGEFKDHIRCHMNIYPFSPELKYEALSYCWGDVRQKRKIKVNGKIFMITENLRSALRRLRLRNESRILWIDAICIDQDDPRERTIQVGMMGDIYKGASKVLVWLGRQDLELEKLYTKNRKEGSANPDRDTLLGAVLNMLMRDWFDRVWVVQEIGLAKEAQLFCGRFTADWDEYASEVERSMQMALSQGPPFGMLGAFRFYYNNFHALQDVRNSGDRTSPAGKLLDILVKFRSRNATQAVDKVYGLLGLVPEAELLGIHADYELRQEDAFKQTMAKLITHTSSLDALGLADHHAEPKTTNLPSWVADWSISSPTARPLRYGEKFKLRKSQAAGDSVAETFLTGDCNLLGLLGYTIDRIDQVSEYLRNFFPSDQRIVSSSPMYILTSREDKPDKPEVFDSIAGLAQSAYTMSRPLEVFLEWEKMAGLSAMFREADFKARERYMETICTGIYLDGDREATLKAYDEWSQSIRSVRNMKKVGLDYFPKIFKPAALWAQIKAVRKGATKFDGAMENAWYRSLATTASGGLALVPAGARKGDAVMLCKGGRFPLVMRKEGEMWTLVGEAYIHGVMNGERWDANLCEPMLVK